MKYAMMLQLSSMVTLWGMLAVSFYGSDGSASRAAVAHYTQSTAFSVQLVVAAMMVPLLQLWLGESFSQLAATASSFLSAPSLAGVLASFTMVTLAMSAGIVAFVGGMAFRQLMAELFAPMIAPEPESQVSTAAE